MLHSLCPHCGKVAYDVAANQCANCGVRGLVSEDPPVLDQTSLAGLLQNVRLFMTQLGDRSFQQILGPFSPRVGYGEDDGVNFTDETASRTCQYFRQHGVLCLWLAMTADGHTQHTVMVANSETGLDRGVRAAKKAASQIRARLEIKAPPSDA